MASQFKSPSPAEQKRLLEEIDRNVAQLGMTAARVH